jgi:hypothetical protein
MYASYYSVLMKDERWAERVEHMKILRHVQNIIIIIIEYSRILLCMFYLRINPPPPAVTVVAPCTLST